MGYLSPEQDRVPLQNKAYLPSSELNNLPHNSINPDPENTNICCLLLSVSTQSTVLTPAWSSLNPSFSQTGEMDWGEPHEVQEVRSPALREEYPIQIHPRAVLPPWGTSTGRRNGLTFQNAVQKKNAQSCTPSINWGLPCWKIALQKRSWGPGGQVEHEPVVCPCWWGLAASQSQ